MEHKYVLEVDKANQNIRARQIERKGFTDIGTDTEIEVVLPVVDEVSDKLDRLYIAEFCRKYPIFTTDISFKFSMIDDSNLASNLSKTNENIPDSLSTTITDQLESDKLNILAKGFLTALTGGPPRAKVTIDYPALHPISSEKWNKTDSIHSYKPEEFVRRVLNLKNKEITVYDVLRRIREGSNIKRTGEHEISVEKLTSLRKEDLGKRMKLYYDQLKDALPPPTKISLPHASDKKQRMAILKARIASLYDIDSDKESVYKSVHGYHDDGIVQYPFFVEIFAIPFKPCR
jgi:hypothetical protein